MGLPSQGRNDVVTFHLVKFRPGYDTVSKERGKKEFKRNVSLIIPEFKKTL